jgi:hypothetical protein
MRKINIPYLGAPDTPIIVSSQEHLPIADICEDVVLYKDGGVALIMESTSLNFSLLSEKEQEAVIAAYAALLNSLSFSIQIFVQTQRKDISSYMKYLDESAKKITNPKLYRLMQAYRKFILESVKKKNVLGKRFYVVLPFSPLELGIVKSIGSITKGRRALPYPKSYIIKKAKVILYPRRDHLVRQMGRLSIKLRQLATNELIELFRGIYDPRPPIVVKEMPLNT